jgi:hypothetical protein
MRNSKEKEEQEDRMRGHKEEKWRRREGTNTLLTGDGLAYCLLAYMTHASQDTGRPLSAGTVLCVGFIFKLII